MPPIVIHNFNATSEVYLNFLPDFLETFHPISDLFLNLYLINHKQLSCCILSQKFVFTKWQKSSILTNTPPSTSRMNPFNVLIEQERNVRGSNDQQHEGFDFYLMNFKISFISSPLWLLKKAKCPSAFKHPRITKN